ncbi:MAG: glycosyltransferase family 4 protein [Lachnospiraceae bacterium]|jgi:glycosyltransferase involved in cell wall biosynthesis|nr:glycosyltransferase family 4 protein [Lachnospiraceae bacterium]
MRIAVLFSGDMEHLSLGGIDRYLKSIISLFNDHEITVFGTGVYGMVKIGKRYEKEYGGKKYYFIPISCDKHRPLSIFYLINEIRYIGKLKEFDYIYVQRIEYTLPFFFSKQRKKVIQIIHGSSKYSEIFFGNKLGKVHLAMEKIAIRIAPITFVILNREEFGVPYYKKKYPKDANKIYYAYNPINTDIFYKKSKYECRKKLNLPCSKKIVTYVGRLDDDPKRVLKIPYICKELNKLELECIFLIVGNGADENKMKQEVAFLHLSEQFIFTGYIEDISLIADYYNASDIAINISIFEGTCTSNLEAIACKTPVLSTDVGDIHEVIKNGNNGIIIPNDHNNLVKHAADAIYQALAEPIPMSNEYLKYSGNEVAEQLKQNFFKEK